MHILCQSPNCNKTYPLHQFKSEDKNITCDVCGGVVIDNDGMVKYSHLDLPNISIKELMDCDDVQNDYRRNLSERFKALSISLFTIGSITNHRIVTRKEIEQFQRNINKCLDELNRLKNDVMNYYAR